MIAITLKPVDVEHYPTQWLLWCSLQHRLLEPDINISHKNMPSWSEHLHFLNKKPYRWWDIIQGEKWYERHGVAYVSHNNEVFTWLFPNARRQKIASQVIAQYKQRVMQDDQPCLLANINPKNIVSVNFFEKMGFRPYSQILDKQITLKWTPDFQ